MAGDLGPELAAAVRRQIIERTAAELVQDLGIFVLAISAIRFALGRTL